MGKLSLELKKLTLKAKQLFYLLILGNKFIENKFVAFFHFYELQSFYFTSHIGEINHNML